MIKNINIPEERSKICDKILRSLPKWFGIESSIVDYVKDVAIMETWASYSNNELNGFISVNKHNTATAEIHVIGVSESFHKQGIGKLLIQEAEKYLAEQDFKYLTVKTLSELRSDENYEKTRHFYLAMGFSPVEVFKTLWGEHNPCLLMIKNIVPAPTRFKGMIVEESLKDPTLINAFSVSKVEISSPSHWHIYTVSTNEDYILSLQKFIKVGPWYIHFWNDKEVIVVFQKKIFKFLKTDKNSWECLKTYGREVGIPESQLDFGMD